MNQSFTVGILFDLFLLNILIRLMLHYEMNFLFDIIFFSHDLFKTNHGLTGCTMSWGFWKCNQEVWHARVVSLPVFPEAWENSFSNIENSFYIVHIIIFFIQLVYTHVSATPNSSLLDNVRVEEREVDDQKRQENISAALTILNHDINNRVNATNPTQQDEVDDIIMYVNPHSRVVYKMSLCVSVHLSTFFTIFLTIQRNKWNFTWSWDIMCRFSCRNF